MYEQNDNLKRYRIDDLVLDTGTRKLFRDDQLIELPKLSFDLLVALVEAAPNVASADQLIETVWGNVVVSDETLTQRVKMLRDSLHQDGDKQRYIETVRSVGYRLRPMPAEISIDTNFAAVSAAPITGISSRNKIAVVTVLLAMCAILILYFNPATRIDSASTAPAKGSIAVLPFVAMSDGVDDEYFADGVTEEVLNALAQLPDLLVTARTSAFYFKGRNIPVQEIAATLGVAHVVEGSVRRDRDQLRITAQLVRAEDGFHVWSDTFDHPSDDIFAVQMDIAERVSAALDIVLDDSLREKMRAVGVRDPEAFVAYQKGLELFDRAHGGERMLELLAEANTYFEQAIDREPTFIDAYIRHSDYNSHVVLYDAAGAQADGFSAEEIAAADASLLADFDAAIRFARDNRERLNVELDEAIFVGDWQNLSELLGQVLAEPDCKNSNWLDVVALPYGFAAASAPLITRRVECDPLRFSARLHQIRLLFWLGEFDMALEAAMDASQDFDHPFFRIAPVVALIGMGAHDKAEALIERGFDDELTATGAEYWLAVSRGDEATGRRLLARFREIYSASPGDMMAYHALLGDRAEVNRIAALADENRYGHMELAHALLLCYCGAPFDIDATPNFARRIEISGLSWPPVEPVKWPLKFW